MGILGVPQEKALEWLRERAQPLSSTLRLSVGGLHDRTDERELRKYFASFGQVQEVRVLRESDTLKSKCCGLLTIASCHTLEDLLGTVHEIHEKVVKLEPQKESSRVLISGLEPALSRKALEAAFSKFGRVEDVLIVRDAPSRGSVKFVTPAAAKKCLDSGPSVKVKGVQVRVQRDEKAKRDKTRRRPEDLGPHGAGPAPGSEAMAFAQMWGGYGSGYPSAHDWPSAYPFRGYPYPPGPPGYGPPPFAAYYGGFGDRGPGAYGDLAYGSGYPSAH